MKNKAVESPKKNSDNQTNQVSRNKKRLNLQDIFFYVGVLVAIIIMATVLFESTKKYNIGLKEKVHKIESTGNVNKDYNKLKSSHDLTDMDTSITYDEARKKYPDVVKNPNLSSSKPNANNNNVQENVKVVFDGYKFDPDIVTITKSSIVTWENPSNKTIRIQGKGWSSLSEIKPKSKYSQEFDFPGEYDYWVQGIETAKGKIIVK